MEEAFQLIEQSIHKYLWFGLIQLDAPDYFLVEAPTAMMGRQLSGVEPELKNQQLAEHVMFQI